MSGPLSKNVIDEITQIGDKGQRILRRRMDSVGDGSGITNMGAAADIYYLTPNPDIATAPIEEYIINSLRIIIEDDGDFLWTEFGCLGAGLADGCVLRIQQLNVDEYTEVFNFHDGATILTNADLLSLGNVSLSLGVPRSVLTCDIQFRDLLGYPLRIQGRSNYTLSFDIINDLVGIERMEIWAHGIIGTQNIV